MICLSFKELLEAGEEKWGTDEEVFNRIFSINDFYTLNRVWTEYVKVRKNMERLLDDFFMSLNNFLGFRKQ